MHTVIAAQCSGCELCLPPCPVDCIALVPMDAPAGTPDPWPDYTRAETRDWRARTQARLARLRPKHRRPLRRHTAGGDARLRDAPSPQEMRREIDAAVERVKRRRARQPATPAAEK
jgi:electron transport complex protein RnfB